MAPILYLSHQWQCAQKRPVSVQKVRCLKNFEMLLYENISVTECKMWILPHKLSVLYIVMRQKSKMYVCMCIEKRRKWPKANNCIGGEYTTCRQCCDGGIGTHVCKTSSAHGGTGEWKKSSYDFSRFLKPVIARFDWHWGMWTSLLAVTLTQAVVSVTIQASR